MKFSQPCWVLLQNYLPLDVAIFLCSKKCLPRTLKLIQLLLMTQGCALLFLVHVQSTSGEYLASFAPDIVLSGNNVYIFSEIHDFPNTNAPPTSENIYDCNILST